MKQNLTQRLILVILTVLTQINVLLAQIENGCEAANFGVDADVYSNINSFGQNASALNHTDDWFYNPAISTGLGIGVIENTYAAALQQQLQSGENISLIFDMSVPFNTIHNGKRLLDAIYGRDFYGGNQATDYTAYTQASKNGEDPAIWDTGPMNVTPKNDLIDVYAHLRRDGINGDDDLWLFGGFSRVSNTGDSYFDMELYTENILYDPNTGFTSAGPDEGHSAWQFDAAGNVIKSGDIVVSVNFSTTKLPDIELRIWVERSFWSNGSPANFTFGNEFDGGSNGSQFGYADILPPTSGTYACGLGNSNTTFGPPWGTLDGGGNFSFNYDRNQFAEIGLNLNAFGIDPALNLSTDTGPCSVPFSAVIFKARASSSFTAQLKDFAGPYPFEIPTFVPSEISGDTIDCANSMVTLKPATLTADAFYEWSTTDGNIIGDIHADSINVDAAGTYTLIASSAPGCLVDTSSFYVPEIYPYPAANITAATLYDCGLAATLEAFPLNHIYEWTGPANFTSTSQTVNVAIEGLYIVHVTDPNTSCTAQDSIYLPGGPCIPIDSTLLPTDENMVIILDTLAPIVGFPADVTLYCSDDIDDLNLTGEINWITDNCSEDFPEPYYIDLSIGGACVGSIRYNRLWYVRDNCGNLTYHAQVIDLLDTIPPSFTPPADITVDCNTDLADLTNLGDVVDEFDECDPTIGEATFQDSLVTGISCTGNDVIFRNWSLTDACGNSSFATQMITYGDTIAPSFTIPADITISCHEDPEDLSITGSAGNTSDNCNNTTLDLQYNDLLIPDPNCSFGYTIQRTWSLTDGCGNDTSAVQVIFAEDVTPPVFDVPTDITVSCLIAADSLSILGTPQNISDNCQINIGQPIYRDSIIGTGPCLATRTILRIWELTDLCGNANIQTQQIDFEDVSDPTFTVPQNITIECDQDPNDLNLTGDVFNESDNCTQTNLEASYVDNITSGTPCAGNTIIERTWTLSDDCGNVTQAIQIITMEDSTPPVFSGFAGTPGVSCDSLIPVPEIGTDIFIQDACDTSLTITFNETQTHVICPNVFILRRVWTAEDNCGNIDSLVQEITVEDSDDPVILVFPPDITVSCDSIIPPGGAEVSDNCSSTVTVNVSENIIPGTCDYAYILLRTFSWEDDCGNVNTETQEITVVDETSPTFTAPADTVLSCDANLLDLNQTGTIEDSQDNCDANEVNISYRDSVLVGFHCAGSDRVIRIWEVADTCGNQSEHFQVIDLLDTTPPVFIAPGNITLSCSDDPSDLLLTGTISAATDNCDQNLGTATYQDSVVVDANCITNQEIFRTWILSDECGNTTTALQLITLMDTVAPTFTLPEDITIDCSADVSNLAFTGDVTDEQDNCQSIIGDATYQDSVIINQPCGGSQTIFRTWSLSDLCGNTFSDIQEITLVDTIAPELIIPVDITLDCELNILDLTLTGNASATEDNCDGSAAMVSYRDSVLSIAGCEGEQSIIRIWSAIDNCGNENLGYQSIIVSDETAPTFLVPADITLNCDTDVTDLNITGRPDSLADNCSNINLNIAYQDSLIELGYCNGSYALRRTWTASDDCGNSFAQVQFLEFIDTIAPVFAAPMDVTISCAADPADLSLTGSIDTAGISESCSTNTLLIAYQDSLISGTGCSGNSAIYRTWTITDNCDNSHTEVQFIYVEDQTAPSFTIPEDVTLHCGTDISLLPITGVVTNIMDDCSQAVLTPMYTDSIVQGSSDCSEIELIYRNWTISDDCGNTHTETQMITLEDVLPPVFFSPSDTAIHCSVNALDTSITGIAFGMMDICDANLGEAIFSDSLVISDTCDLDRAIYRTWSLADACGNTSEYLQIVYLIDTVGPSFTVPSDITISCAVDPTDLSISGAATDAYFNCQDQNGQVTYIDSLVLSPICNENRIYRNWTLSNGCGQDTSQLQIITLIDTIAPIFTNTAPDLSISCGDAIPTFIPQYIDSCGSLVDLTVEEDTIVGECLTRITIVRKYIISDQCGNQDSLLQNILVESCDAALELISPDNIEACPGNEITLIVGLNEPASATNYQWQFWNNNQWENITGATDSILIISNIDSTYAGNYRCLAAGEVVVVASDSCTLISPEINVQIAGYIPIEIFSQAICAGDSFLINNQYQSTAGVYMDTLISVAGCDSIVQVDLDILPISTSYEAHNICIGDSIWLKDTWIYSSILLADTLDNVHGCDSIHTTEVVVSQWLDVYEVIELCIGDSLFINGNWESQAGMYTDTLLGTLGCDTILHTTLSFNSSLRDSVDIVLCAGDSIFFDDQFISTAGQWTDTLTAAAGCDSITTIFVQVLPRIQTDSSVVLCEGDSVFIEGAWQHTNGIFSDTLTASNGCDSLVNINLSFNPTYNQIDSLALCQGDSIMIFGTVIYDGGIYIDSLTTALGCDSIIQQVVTVHPLFIDTLFQEICIGESFVFNGDTLFSEGQYAADLTSQYGCDSLVILDLDVIIAFENSVTVDLCPGDSTTIAGAVIYDAGTYVDSLVSQFGCDSIITHEVIVHPRDTNDLSEQLCLGDYFIFNNDTLYTSGNYSASFNNQYGCDSLVRLSLAFIEASIERDTVMLCEGDTIVFGGVVIDQTGTYTDSLTSQLGCDSIVQQTVIIHPLDTTNLLRQICAGDFFVFDSDTLTTTGIYSSSFTNQYNCDSLVILDLEVIDAFENTMTIDLCPGDSTMISGTVIYNAGTYIDSLISQYGCDSIITHEVIVHPLDTNDLNRQLCIGEYFVFDSDTLFTSGDYSASFSNQYGCDSLVRLSLEFIEAFIDRDTVSYCEGETIIFGGELITQMGTYTDSLVSQFGCDSIIQQTVIIHPLDTTNLPAQICAGDFYIFNNDTLTTTGIYSSIFTNQYNCDSLVVLDLEVLDALTTNLTHDLCPGDSTIIAGTVIYVAGTYIDSLISQYGCDSIITHEVIVHPLDTIDLSRQLCIGEYFVFDSDTLFTSGDYSASFSNQYGCDSLVRLSLEFLETIIAQDTITRCEGETVLFGGTIIVAPGTYSDSLISHNGCDSIIQRTILFTPLDTTDLQQQICTGEYFVFNNDTLTNSGFYSEVLSNQYGCDSLVNLTLAVVEAIEISLREGICPDDSVLINGLYYDSDTVLIFEEITSSTGCDSITTIEVFYYETYLENIDYQICEGDSLELFGIYYSEPTEIIEESQSQYGCDSSIIHRLEIIPRTNLIVDDAFICLGDTVQLEVEGAEDVVWSPATGLSCTNCANPVASPEVTTTYTVSSSSCLGESATQLVTVYVYELPSIEVIADGELILGDTLELTYQVSDTSATISWYNAIGETICSGNCPDTLEVIPQLNNLYIVEAMDEEGCVAQDEILVQVKNKCEDAEFFFPNFITPNFDGKNDEFVVTYNAVKEVSLLRIFNRWGELVFETTDLDNNHWDGSFRGKPVNAGVFVFYVEGFCLNNLPFIEKGNITVIR